MSALRLSPVVQAPLQYERRMKRNADELGARMVHRRAIEAVIWGMPAVNYHLMYKEMVHKTNGAFNQVLYWSRLLDWKNQTLTPNPDVIYLMPFINTEEVGPVVLEIPPDDDGVFNGSVMNYWQTAIEDVGPGGVDKGKGGKYLILPPGYDMNTVPAGYIAMPSDTYRGYALLRSVLKSGSDADVAQAVRYAKRMRLYPLSQAATPPETIFLDAADVVIDSTIPYDLRFFESLERDGPGRAVARARSRDDRSAQDDRHRARQAVRAGRAHAAHSRRRDRGSASLARRALRQPRAVLRRRALVLPDHRRDVPERDELLENAELLSDRCARHCLHARVLQRQASRPVAVLSVDRARQPRASRSRADRPIACTFRRTCPSRSTGR